jgi:hypothetical protein
MLDQGKDLGMPDGVLINGKGPYRYNDSLVPAGIDHETIDVHPGNSPSTRPLLLSTTCILGWQHGKWRSRLHKLHRFYSELCFLFG